MVERLAVAVTDSLKPNPLVYLALGLGILSLSFSAIFVRWAEAPGTVASFYRVGIAALLMVGPFYRGAKTKGPLPRQGIRLALLGGMFFAADLGFWTTGVVLSGATNPTLLANTAPLWVGLGAVVLFRERLDITFWSGLTVAMGGAFVILGLDAGRGLSFGMGSFFGLLAGIFYGGYFLITQRGREFLDALTFFWPAAFSSTLSLFLVCLAAGQSFIGYPTHTYVLFLGMGLVNQVLGYLSINYALGHLPASLVAPTMLGQPVITALLAWLLLGEELLPWQLLGGAAVLAGVWAVHHSRQADR